MKGIKTETGLAWLVVLGGGTLYALTRDTAVLALVTMVVSYYFGSSTGSKAKDLIIKNLEAIIENLKKQLTLTKGDPT